MSVCVYVCHMCLGDAERLDLELQVVVSCLIWVLAIKSRSTRAVSALNPWAISPLSPIF